MASWTLMPSCQFHRTLATMVTSRMTTSTAMTAPMTRRDRSMRGNIVPPITMFNGPSTTRPRCAASRDQQVRCNMATNRCFLFMHHLDGPLGRSHDEPVGSQHPLGHGVRCCMDLYPAPTITTSGHRPDEGGAKGAADLVGVGEALASHVHGQDMGRPQEGR